MTPQQRYDLAHPHRRAEINAAYDARNREKRAAYARARRAANPGYSSERKKAWLAKNPGYAAQATRARTASKRSATPAWASRGVIADLYKYAAIMRDHGIACHVDHTVPLASDLVCGLHCEANLTVLAEEDNLRKSNRYWPDMP